MTTNPPPSQQAIEKARALHARAFILDSHVDTVSEMADRGYDLGNAPDDVHLSWEKIATGGLKAQVFACYVSPKFVPDRAAAEVDRLIDRFEEETRRFPEKLIACRSGSDLEAARRAGRFSGMLAIEGGHAIEDSLDTLRRFHARGVRAMTLTWNNTNGWADGCGPMDPKLPQHGGLNDLGRKVVGTMEEIGMAVDISHVAPATFWDVLDHGGKPPFASHSSVKAINHHRRNLDDAQMRALADKGGVMSVCLVSPFLVDEAGRYERAKKDAGYVEPGTPLADRMWGAIPDVDYDAYCRMVVLATLDDAADHVEHALRVMGTGAVGLGSDFDGARRFPVGLDHVGLLPNLTARLLERGWREEELTGFLGENLLDYFKRVLG
jgi:membrane dipeptidase